MKIYIGLHVKYPLSLSDFNDIWIFWTDFRQILKSQIFYENLSSGKGVVAYRQADMTKLMVAFPQFCGCVILCGILCKTNKFYGRVCRETWAVYLAWLRN
jgi:hypothetical protein